MTVPTISGRWHGRNARGVRHAANYPRYKLHRQKRVRRGSCGHCSFDPRGEISADARGESLGIFGSSSCFVATGGAGHPVRNPETDADIHSRLRALASRSLGVVRSQPPSEPAPMLQMSLVVYLLLKVAQVLFLHHDSCTMTSIFNTRMTCAEPLPDRQNSILCSSAATPINFRHDVLGPPDRIRGGAHSRRNPLLFPPSYCANFLAARMEDD
jgi:hypothetical protein